MYTVASPDPDANRLGEGVNYLTLRVQFYANECTPCIMCVQYIGGCSVHRGVFSTSGGYHEYIGGCSVHRGDIMMNVGDTMSTSGDVQYIGGIP